MMTARSGGGFCVQNPWHLAYGSGQKARRAPDEATGPSGADGGAAGLRHFDLIR